MPSMISRRTSRLLPALLALAVKRGRRQPTEESLFLGEEPMGYRTLRSLRPGTVTRLQGGEGGMTAV